MLAPVWITGVGSVSAAGNTSEDFWNQMVSGKTAIRLKEGIYQATVSDKTEAMLMELRGNRAYKRLDRTVLLAILAARQLEGALSNTERLAVNIGSSRGATTLFESYYDQYKQGLPPLASPTTTLGNISSWVAQDLGSRGFTMSHSITCSTALHGILNAIGWLSAGFARQVVVGGAEAPLTPFTFAQMQALPIYSCPPKAFPCTPLMLNKKENDMVLGEGAVVFCLETSSERPIKVLAAIRGVGFYQEPIRHATDIDQNGLGLQHSMQQAMQQAGLKQVDALVLHAPGTLAGERAELNAIDMIWEERPFLVTNKNIIGHTFGASGGFGLQLALEMLQRNEVVYPEYPMRFEQVKPKQIQSVLVNAIGFGGNAISVILTKD